MGRENTLIWKVPLTVTHCLAISSSVFRFYRRRKTRQIWWDDHVASMCFLLDCLYFSTLWLREKRSKELLIVTAWLAQVTFIMLIWCTRISLALSITRTIPPHQPIRKFNIFLTYIFVIFCIGFVADIGVACNQNPSNWMNTPPYQCPISVGTAAARMLVDCIADVALIIVPLVAFWRLKLPDMPRRLIQACFSATLLTGLILIFTSSILFARTSAGTSKDRIAFLASILAHLIASTSLLVCNLLIVVTSFYRLLRSEVPPTQIGANHRALAAASTLSSGRTMAQDTQTGTGYLESGTYTEQSSSTEPLELTQIFESDLSACSYPVTLDTKRTTSSS